MAKCPFAVWKPLPENKTADEIDPRIVILHTAVANVPSLFGFFGKVEETKESHFFISSQGVIEQYMDTERQADANRNANDFAISVENQDNAKNPIAPMSDKQLEANIKLFRWCSDVHPKIKRQRCDKWNGSGYGYHSMWGAPSQWTPVKGKTCPGSARIAQFEKIMIPALIAPYSGDGEEDEMRTWFVRGPKGDVYVFDGVVLRPANSTVYRGILKMYGTEGDPWQDWSQAQIDAVPKMPGN